MRLAFLVAGTVLASGLVGPLHAGNEACWGNNSREEVTCVALTESLLLRLRGARRAQVIALLGMPGRRFANGEMRWLSNHGRGAAGSGSLNVTFDGADRAAVIIADVDTAESLGGIRWVWNRDQGGLRCSDFPRSRRRCR
jgi:hypothetical protein